MFRIRYLAAVPLAAAALLAPAAAASATPVFPALPVHALTFVTDRPDSGNGTPDPYWADDSFYRTLTITRTGGSPGNWTFTAQIDDTGFFTTIKGAQVPNQSPPWTGQVIRSTATGVMAGYADFTFTASTLPSSGFVPRYENDHGLPPADSTSTWYELAFPAGTTFGGAGIGVWSWTYTAFTPRLQQWADAWNNGAGDLPGDGQITG